MQVGRSFSFVDEPGCLEYIKNHYKGIYIYGYIGYIRNITSIEGI